MLQRLKSFLLENRGTRQTVAKNVFWLSVSQLGSRLIRAALVIYAARALGAAEYGIFSYLVGLAGFFTVFTDLGVGPIMTREAAKHPAHRSYYFATGFWIKIVLLLPIVLFIIFVMPYLSKAEGAKILIPLVALLVIFDGMREFILSFFRALEKMEWEAFINTTTNLLILCLGFAALYISVTAKTLLIAYILSVTLGAAIAVSITKEEIVKIFGSFRKNLIKPIMSAAIPIALSSAIGAFMFSTDIIMLGWWQSTEDIGFYSAGQKIVQLSYVLPAILASALFPALARLIGEKNDEKIRHLLEKSFTTVLLVAIPLTIGGIILGRPIIELIYGQEYLPATLNFQILLVTVLIVFPGTLTGNVAIAYDKQKELTKYLLGAAIANAVFNALFIPRLGIIGSSLSTIIALTLDVSLVWLLIRKINSFRTLPHLKKIIFAAVIMGAFSFVLNKIDLNVIVNIVISALIYFGILYLLKEKTLNELKPLIRQASA